MKLKHTQKKSANRSFRPVPFNPADPWNQLHFKPKKGSKTQARKLRERESKQLRNRSVQNPKGV